MSGRKRTSSLQKATAFEQELFGNRRIKSELADLLISLWTWGKISAVHVQEVAQAALNDAQKHTADFNIYEWEVLSKLGSGGHNKQNILHVTWAGNYLLHFAKFLSKRSVSRLRFPKVFPELLKFQFLSFFLVRFGDRLGHTNTFGNNRFVIVTIPSWNFGSNVVITQHSIAIRAN